MSQENEKQGFSFGPTDCAVVIKENLEINIVMPNLQNLEEEPSENLGQAMFLTSFLSYALNKQEWVNEFGELFEKQDPEVMQHIFGGELTDEEIEEFTKEQEKEKKSKIIT